MALQQADHRDNATGFVRRALGTTGVTMLAPFLMVLGEAQLKLGLIFFMREVFDSSQSVVGWLAATAALSYILGCFLVRRWLTGMAPRRLMIAAAFANCLVALAMRAAPAEGWVFVCSAGRGLAMSLFWPPLMGWLSSGREGKDLNRALARFNLSWSAGAIVGPFVAGWLTQVAVGLPLLAAAGLFLANTALIVGASAGRAASASGHGREDAGGAAISPQDQSTALRYPAWLGLYATFFGIAVVMAMFPMAAKDELGMHEGIIGSILLVRSFANTAAFIFMGRTVFWHSRSMLMPVMLALSACAFLVMPHLQSAVAIGAVLVVLGFCGAFCYTCSMFHGVSGSTGRARRMAFHEATLAAGIVTGSAVGGMVYHAFSIVHVYVLSGLFLGAAALASVPLLSWARSRDAANGL